MHELSERLSAMQCHLNKAYDRSFDNVQKTLVDDDRRLLQSEKQIAALQPDANHNQIFSKFQALCSRLTLFRTEEVRRRLDRCYLEALCRSEDEIANLPTIDGEGESALEKELDDIYTEIAEVNQLVITQEHLNPITQNIAAVSARRHAYAYNGLGNVCRYSGAVLYV